MIVAIIRSAYAYRLKRMGQVMGHCWTRQVKTVKLEKRGEYERIVLRVRNEMNQKTV